MLVLQARRAFQRHGAADMDVGLVDVGLGEAEAAQQVEAVVVELLVGDLEHRLAEVFAQGPLVEDELDVEGRGQARLDLLDLGIAEALGAQLRMVQGGRVLQRAMAHGITDDLLDLGLVIAQRTERLGHRLVDDLEVAAAGQLLELHQREVGFDAGGIAVHDEADGAGGRDDRRLGHCDSHALRPA